MLSSIVMMFGMIAVSSSVKIIYKWLIEKFNDQNIAPLTKISLFTRGAGFYFGIILFQQLVSKQSEPIGDFLKSIFTYNDKQISNEMSLFMLYIALTITYVLLLFIVDKSSKYCKNCKKNSL